MGLIQNLLRLIPFGLNLGMSSQCQRKCIFAGWSVFRFKRVLEKIFLAQQNIFHACGEDIDLIYHYADEQNLLNVFDTQVGLSFWDMVYK